MKVARIQSRDSAYELSFAGVSWIDDAAGPLVLADGRDARNWRGHTEPDSCRTSTSPDSETPHIDELPRLGRVSTNKSDSVWLPSEFYPWLLAEFGVDCVAILGLESWDDEQIARAAIDSITWRDLMRGCSIELGRIDVAPGRTSAHLVLFPCDADGSDITSGAEPSASVTVSWRRACANYGVLRVNAEGGVSWHTELLDLEPLGREGVVLQLAVVALRPG